MAIDYELDGSPKEHFSWNGLFVATRKLVCPWTDRLTEKATLLTPPGATYPGMTSAFARTVDIEGFGEQKGSGLIAAYDKAILTVAYRTAALGDPVRQDNGLGTEIVFAEDVEPCTEFQRMSEEGLTWATGGRALTEAEAPGRIVAGFTYVFTRFGWEPSSYTMAAVLGLVGCVNQETISSLTLGVDFEPETLFFLDPSFHREWDSAGNAKLTATFRMAYRYKSPVTARNGGKGGWNQFWRSDGGDDENGGFDEIKNEKGNVVLYAPPSDLFTEIRV